MTVLFALRHPIEMLHILRMRRITHRRLVALGLIPASRSTRAVAVLRLRMGH